MNIDPSTPNREVLIRYLADSGVNQQKEAAAEMRVMQNDILQMEARIMELEAICGESYQVVGALASDCGRFEDDDVIRALDNLSCMELIYDNVLPFESKKPSFIGRIVLWFKKGN